MKYFVLVLSLCLSVSIFAQEEKILPVAQEMPTLEICAKSGAYADRRACSNEKVEAMLAQYVEYPEAAKQAGIDAHVIVRFVVDEKGKAIDHKVDEDPGYELADAAIKAVKKLGKWTAGSNRGKPVKVLMTIPVHFTPEKKAMEESKVVMPEIRDVAEQMPRFLACDKGTEAEAKSCTHQALAQHLRLNMNYPAEAAKDNVKGPVVVKFVVNETGAVTDAVVEKSLHPACDAEALRLVNSLPTWTPGKDKGQPVKVRMMLPIHFMPTAKE